VSSVRYLVVAAGAALVVLSVLLFPFSGENDREVRVAVASNFAGTLEELGPLFTEKTGYTVAISVGSTGQFYSLIRHGRPFDVFLAADALRPKALEEMSMTVPGTRQTYAIGKLVLWSRSVELADSGEPDWQALAGTRVAVANPKTAPYGKAAEQTLQSLVIAKQFVPQLVIGQSIGQVFQFVATGNADGGFIAASQSQNADGPLWAVPAALHEPIIQQMVLLTDTPEGHAFIEFMNSDAARAVITANGYDTP